MKTITLQIGNTDNKLSQGKWAEFVDKMARRIEDEPTVTVHFFGGPHAWAPWQNVAWVLLIDEHDIPSLMEAVTVIRVEYQQDSVAWTEGTTVFI
jgi:hypothetical protein